MLVDVELDGTVQGYDGGADIAEVHVALAYGEQGALTHGVVECRW